MLKGREWFVCRSPAARDTDMQIWEVEVNKIVDEIEDLFSWSWHTRVVRTLIECVHNEINRALSGK